MKTRIENNSNNSLVLDDVNPYFFNHFTSLALKTMSKVSQRQKKLVNDYIKAQLNPYDSSCSQIPSLEYAKRALALAVTFNHRRCMESILSLHPEILFCVLETRTVTIKDPLTGKSFTAKWHFKLSHLLAAEGNVWGHQCVYNFFAGVNYQQKLNEFFSESICWESGDLSGSKGPTSPFIAILYNQVDFFKEIANKECALTLADGFDEPFITFNPCYLCLQQALASPLKQGFYTLMQQYAHLPMMKDCIDIIITEALQGNYASLNFIFVPPSERLGNVLSMVLFKAIETNNMELIRKISIKIDDFIYLNNEQGKTPLVVAAQKALKDAKHLPLVKHFLCCGCLKSPLEDLLEKVLGCTLGLADLLKMNEHAPVTLIRRYVKAAEFFQRVVLFCQQSEGSPRLSFSRFKADPVSLLQQTAELDKAFFNELVVSLLENDDEWMLNKTLNLFEHRKRYFTCLFNFMTQHQDRFFLTGETLERIADSLITYRKASVLASCRDNLEALNMAMDFYKMVKFVDAPDSKCCIRVKKKLNNIGEHVELNLGYLSSTTRK